MGSSHSAASSSSGFKSEVDAFLHAASTNDVAKLKTILDHQLAEAAGGHPSPEKVAQAREQVAAKLNATVDGNQMTALHLACDVRRADEAVALLLERGADLNSLTCRNNTPLHCALRSFNIEAVRLLLKHREGLCRWPAVRLVWIGYKKNRDNPACPFARLPRDVVRIISAFVAPALQLTRAGATHKNFAPLAEDRFIRQANNDGHTPLELAVRQNLVDAVEMILACGAVMERTHFAGYTVLHHAASFGHLDAMRVLVRWNGGKDCRSIVNQLNERGETPLYRACCNGLSAEDKKAMLKLLIDAGAHKTLAAVGITPEQELRNRRQPEVASWLVAYV